MDDYGPYDPTLEYSAEPAIKELSPERADIPAWKPLNMTRRSFLRGVVCSGIVIAVSGISLLVCLGARPSAQARPAVSRRLNPATYRCSVMLASPTSRFLVRLGVPGRGISVGRQRNQMDRPDLTSRRKIGPPQS